MSLPNLPYGDKLRREVRTEWGGLNLNESAGDGELIEAMNMSSRAFPLLATSYGKSQLVRNCSGLKAFFIAARNGNDQYVHLSMENRGGDWMLCTNGSPLTLGGELSGAAHTQMVQMQDKIYIFPDKKVFDLGTLRLTDMESSVTVEAGDAFFTDGEVYGVEAQNNALQAYGTLWGNYFREGDAVTISGSRDEENNKTIVIREITPNYLFFDENSFAPGWVTFRIPTGGLAAGTYYFQTRDGGYKSFQTTALDLGEEAGHGYFRDGDATVSLEWYENREKQQVTRNVEDYSEEEPPSSILATAMGLQENNPVTVARTVPDIKRACVSDNRLWGFDGDTIYASKLGDPLNFNVFDGLSTDSWAVEVRKQMDFTACITYRGYPTFFKPDYAVRVLGDEPGNFTLDELEIPGIPARTSGPDGVESPTVVRNALYYLSTEGVVAWHGSGDYATISEALGIDKEWGGIYRGGTDGHRYYLSSGPMGGTGGGSSYVYDPRFGTWHQEDHKACFFGRDSHGFYIAESAAVYQRFPTTQLTGSDAWSVTFADSTRAYKTVLTGSESKKGVLRLLIRCKTAYKMKVWLAYDGGAFEEAAEVGGEKTSYIVPLILRRCDFWQLRLTGTGAAVIYSIAVERYGGEWQQAK